MTKVTVSIPTPNHKTRANLVEGLCKILCAVFVCNISVRRVIPEELGFALESVSHAFLRVDILLTAINNANEA